MEIIDSYLSYVRNVRRFSERTVSIYEGVLNDYLAFISSKEKVCSETDFVSSMNLSEIREYEVHMLDGKKPKSAKTVNLHLSALSGFCRYLMQQGLLKSNPVKLITKPKVEKRIPQFIRKDAMKEYFEYEPEKPKTRQKEYNNLLEKVVIATLYSLGIRRAELIGMLIGDVDFGRNVVKVRGKGDKMREIPLVPSLSE